MKKVITILFIFFFATTISAQSKLSLGIDGGLASPSGDVGDLFDSGFGLRVTGHYPLSSSFELLASAGYYSWSYKEDYFEDIAPGSKVDATLTNIPIVIGANYFLSSGKFRPYLTLELGLHLLSVDVPSTSGGVDVNNTSTSETGTGWGLGAGFLYAISPKLDLNLIAKFNGNNYEFGQSSTSVSNGVVTTNESSSTMTYLTISGGVRFGL
jgi:opacity protein-like surface antigen